jgi:hypothetical protein
VAYALLVNLSFLSVCVLVESGIFDNSREIEYLVSFKKIILFYFLYSLVILDLLESVGYSPS